FGYTITQFAIFFVRANDVVALGPLNWGLKQAQWTSLIVFILLIPVTIFFMRTKNAQPVPDGEVAATYGIPQAPTPDLPDDDEEKETDGTAADQAEPEESETDDVPAADHESEEVKSADTK
ncbi:MAG TPA: hypothetical protein VF458_18970, partial [Ktedonobacteraceae bacterium]